jgi:hypothetical protein
MRSSRPAVLPITVLLAVAVAGCVSETPDTPTSDGVTTVVQLGPNGATVVEVHEPDGDGVKTQAITGHSGVYLCNGQAIRLYSATGYTGDVICFVGAGTAQLEDYCQNGGSPPCATWSRAVRSYRSVKAKGYLAGYPGSPPAYCNESFDVGSQVSSAGTCGRAATKITTWSNILIDGGP